MYGRVGASTAISVCLILLPGLAHGTVSAVLPCALPATLVLDLPHIPDAAPTRIVVAGRTVAAGAYASIARDPLPVAEHIPHAAGAITVLSPARGGIYVALWQWKMGYVKLNGQYVDHYTVWTADPTDSQPTSDSSGKVYIWDAPGVDFPNEWGKAPDATSWEMDRSYMDKAFWPADGRRMSDPISWHRLLELTGPLGGYFWSKPAISNQ